MELLGNINMNKIPNLFVIGASKCGTTSLWHMLDLHSNVFMTTPKEPWFFSFSNYKDNLGWYSSLFVKVNGEKIIGEASPIYSETTLIPEIPKRLYDFNPDAKIIYIVREPVSRLKSVWRQTLSSGHWHQQVYKNYTDVEVATMPKDFEKAIFEYPPFIEASKYWTHLNNYRKFYNDENILVLFFEDFKAYPTDTYHKICDFLAIKPEENKVLFERKNSSEGKKMYANWYIKLRENQKIYKTLKYIANIVGIQAPKKTIDYSIIISPKVEKKINFILKNEKEQILRYAQKPLNFWNK